MFLCLSSVLYPDDVNGDNLNALSIGAIPAHFVAAVPCDEQSYNIAVVGLQLL